MSESDYTSDNESVDIVDNEREDMEESTGEGLPKSGKICFSMYKGPAQQIDSDEEGRIESSSSDLLQLTMQRDAKGTFPHSRSEQDRNLSALLAPLQVLQRDQIFPKASSSKHIKTETKDVKGLRSTEALGPTLPSKQLHEMGSAETVTDILHNVAAFVKTYETKIEVLQAENELLRERLASSRASLEMKTVGTQTPRQRKPKKQEAPETTEATPPPPAPKPVNVRQQQVSVDDLMYHQHQQKLSHYEQHFSRDRSNSDISGSLKQYYEQGFFNSSQLNEFGSEEESPNLTPNNERSRSPRNEVKPPEITNSNSSSSDSPGPSKSDDTIFQVQKSLERKYTQELQSKAALEAQTNTPALHQRQALAPFQQFGQEPYTAMDAFQNPASTQYNPAEQRGTPVMQSEKKQAKGQKIASSASALYGSGVIFEVYDDERKTVVNLPADSVVYTHGAEMYINALKQNKSLGREICKQFRKSKVCKWNEKCKFIHLRDGDGGELSLYYSNPTHGKKKAPQQQQNPATDQTISPALQASLLSIMNSVNMDQGARQPGVHQFWPM